MRIPGFLIFFIFFVPCALASLLFPATKGARNPPLSSVVFFFIRTAVDEFYEQCDPDKENLCLYGNPDGTWEVQLPAEEVPPALPEPALGINFARDGMQVRVRSVHRGVALKFTSMQKKTKQSKSDLLPLCSAFSSFSAFLLTFVLSPRRFSPPTAAERLAGSCGGALRRVVDGGGVLLRREV